MRFARWSVVVWLATGCGGAQLEGALAMPEGSEPRAAHLQHFVPGACFDEKSEPAPPPPLRVVSVTRSDGSRIVIERRVGYADIFLSHSFRVGQNRVFEYVSKDPDSVRLLHTLSFPKTTGPAELRVSDRFEIETSPGRGPARVGRIGLRCILYPSSTARRLDTTRSVE